MSLYSIEKYCPEDSKKYKTISVDGLRAEQFTIKRVCLILYTGGDEIFLGCQKGAKSIFPSEYHILVTNMPLFHLKTF